MHRKHCRIFGVEPTLTENELRIAGDHLVSAFDKVQPNSTLVIRDTAECGDTDATSGNFIPSHTHTNTAVADFWSEMKTPTWATYVVNNA